MANIGKLALTLTANPAALYSGLMEAGKRIESFAARAAGVFGKVFEGSMFGNMTKGGGLVAGLGDVYKTIKGALFSGLGFGGEFQEEMVGKVNELFPQIMKAGALNMPVEDFMGLGRAFEKVGIDADATTMIIARFTAKVASMTEWGDEKNLLTRNMLDNKTTKEQIYTVLDFLGKFENASDRMAATKDIWGGRQFVKMIPLIKMGTAAVEELIQKEKERGRVISEQEAATIIRAKMALPKLHQAFDGFKNKVLVAFIPLLEFFSNWLGKAGGPLANFLKEAAAGLEVYFLFMVEVWKEIKGGIEAAGEALGDFIKDSLGLGTVWIDTRELVANALVGIAEGLGHVWGAAQAAFASIVVGLANVGKAALTFMEVVADAADTMKELAKNPLGTIPDVLDPIKQFQDRMAGVLYESVWGPAEKAAGRFADLKDALDDFEEFGEGIWDKIGDPGAKAREWAKKAKAGILQGLAEKDAFAVWNSIFGGTDFRNKLKDVGRDYTQSPAALYGSKEAYSIMARFRTGGMTDIERMGKIAAEQLAEQKKAAEEQKRANEIMERIRIGIDKLDRPPGDFGVA